MAQRLDPGAGTAIDLDELVALLDAAPVDTRDEAAFATLGPLLARLGHNRRFLADLAIAELKQRCGPQGATSVYGAQVFLLRPPNGRYLLRANFWPARGDAALRASGAAAFFYDLPHDHNFPFLTYGYLGPGYWSDDYETDGPADRVTGDDAALRFVGRTRLDPGTLLLYRAHRDVHAQRPPDGFSVSLNILGYDLAQPWRSQYRYDLATGRVAGVLTTTPSEALVALAAGFGGENGIDLARHLLRRHPSARMRRTALDALVTAGDVEGWTAALDDPALAPVLRPSLDRLQNGGTCRPFRDGCR